MCCHKLSHGHTLFALVLSTRFVATSFVSCFIFFTSVFIFIFCFFLFLLQRAAVAFALTVLLARSWSRVPSVCACLCVTYIRA